MRIQSDGKELEEGSTMSPSSFRSKIRSSKVARGKKGKFLTHTCKYNICHWGAEVANLQLGTKICV